MRLITILFVSMLGCGSTAPAPIPDMAMAQSGGDMAMALPSLTVNNTLAWCTVTVNTGSGQPTVFDNASHKFDVASGTTVMLNAVPHPNFIQVKWTGVTTMNGANATYVMTAATGQTVTACCPFPDGTGC